MPLQLGKIEEVTTKVIDTAIISNILIKRKEKMVVIDMDYGVIVDGEFKIVDNNSIKLIGNDFLAVATIITTGGITIYDEISNCLYKWLSESKKLKY